MNKKAILALLVALLLPVVSYLILKQSSDGAVHVPRKYLLDTVISSEVDGKIVTDSIWHKTADIRLTNQLGDTVNLYQKQGKIIVMDFFFTSCSSICPKMSNNMLKLQKSFIKGGNTRKKIDTSIVQFISFTVDPERDSVARLKEYADRLNISHENWWMLTGEKKKIYDFAFQELKVDKFNDSIPISPDFVHTSRFVMLDKNMVVRGFYDGTDSASLTKLARDIGLLMLEKDKTKRSTIFTQIIDLSWLWLIIVVAVSGFVFYFSKKRKEEKQ
jgi:protein SCO1